MKTEVELKKIVRALPEGMTHGDFLRLERVYRHGSDKVVLGVRRAIAKAEPRKTLTTKSLRSYYRKNEDVLSGDEEWDAKMLLGYWCHSYYEMYDGDASIDGIRDVINELEARVKKLGSSKVRRGIDAVMEATTEAWWSGGAPRIDSILSPEKWTRFVAPRLNKKPKRKSGEQAEWSGKTTKGYTSKRVV